MFSSDPAVFATPPRVLPDPVPWAPLALGEPAAIEAALPDASPDDLAALEALQREEELESAFARGYEAGVEAARRQDAEKLGAALRALQQAVAALRAAEAQRESAFHDNLCALAVAVANQVVGREVRMDGQVVMELVRRAVAEFPLDQALRVRINPHDLSTLSALSAAEAPPIAPGRELTWVPDPELGRGGVVVEGRERILDGRLDLALERLYRTLANG
ncbi:MAG TPA: FliH/SctL family protein [Longimicrobiales bacterium]|nr:FliH/SctL family protein [Longimicrobiales bacterium]